jgi:hypothetical protein
LDGLLVGERRRLPYLVADHRLAHQFIGKREVALVPDDQVVQLDDFTGRTPHTKTSSAVRRIGEDFAGVLPLLLTGGTSRSLIL